MNSTGDWLGYAIIAAPLVVIVAAIYLIGEMRRHEPDVYEAQGRPHLWFTNPNGLGFLFGFVLLGEYRSDVKEKRIRKICLFVQVATWLWLALVFGFIVFAAAYVF